MLFETSLKMIFLLEVIVFLAGVTDLEVFFLKNIIVSAWIGDIYTGIVNTKSTCSMNICYRSACIGADICFGDAWIKDTDAASTSILKLRMFILPEVQVLEVLVSKVLILRKLIFGIFISIMLVLEVLILGVLVPEVLISRLLVMSSAWKYICNYLES